MPDINDPNFVLSSRWFGLSCLLVTLVMLSLSSALPLAVKYGGALALLSAIAFNFRAAWRGKLSGSPLWPHAPKRDESAMVLARPTAQSVDADVWFAQALSGLAACLLALAVALPLTGAA